MGKALMTRWMMRQIDAFLGAAVAAIGGILGSQFLAFIQQYQQRLGGHLDEAARNLREVSTGEISQLMDEPTRVAVSAVAERRVDALQAAINLIDGSGPLIKPFIFAQHVDYEIANATWHTFQPALPLDAVNLVYAATALVVGWAFYRLVSTPLFGRIRGGHAGNRGPAHES